VVEAQAQAQAQAMSAESYNEKQLADGNLTWEQITALGKLWQAIHGLAADGYIGPNTQASIQAAITPPPHVPDADWELWDGPLIRQPKNRTEVYSLFGNPGTGTVNALWKAQNIRELHGVDRLPGVPDKWYVKLHKDVEPYAREGLRRCQISSTYEIARFGGFVFRHIRHDPDRPLSYHSWGIAFDVDADLNFSRRFSKGASPKPWSPEWMAIWPRGVDEEFVNALASCGFRWGGDWDGDRDAGDHTYIDPMHFEWVGRT
jgi:hypothetical protein